MLVVIKAQLECRGNQLNLLESAEATPTRSKLSARVCPIVDNWVLNSAARSQIPGSQAKSLISLGNYLVAEPAQARSQEPLISFPALLRHPAFKIRTMHLRKEFYYISSDVNFWINFRDVSFSGEDHLELREHSAMAHQWQPSLRMGEAGRDLGVWEYIYLKQK